MDVVFTSDKNYVQHLGVALTSLLENNQDIEWKIHLIHDEIDNSDLMKIKDICTKYHAYFIDYLVDNETFSNLITKHHFKNSNYYRLLIPKLLKNIDPNSNILYLDADIIVAGSLSDLVDLNLDGYYLGAVEASNFNRHSELHMSVASNYFCSGVMLINLEAWKRNSISEKVIEFVEKNPEVIWCVDQCGLNSIINGNWLPLHPRYDQQTSFFEKNVNTHYEEEEIQLAITNPIIVHYTGYSKPWHYMDKHPFKEKYWHYLQKTYWKNYIPDDRTLKNILIKKINCLIQYF